MYLEQEIMSGERFSTRKNEGVVRDILFAEDFEYRISMERFGGSGR